MTDFIYSKSGNESEPLSRLLLLEWSLTGSRARLNNGVLQFQRINLAFAFAHLVQAVRGLKLPTQRLIYTLRLRIPPIKHRHITPQMLAGYR